MAPYNWYLRHHICMTCSAWSWQASVLSLSTPTPLTASATPVHLSEKLPDIPEYDEDKDKLNMWEHALIQRMHVNHDWYLTDTAKIAYTESQLTIDKRAYILMMPYWKDGICTISMFTEYQWILCYVCDNPFEAEDACMYLQNTLKQDLMSFVKYYQLFCQKKNHSCHGWQGHRHWYDAMKTWYFRQALNW